MAGRIGPKPAWREPRAHVVGVCQPGPPVLAAAAIMAAEDDPNRPASMTFMGSPIDARLSPTVTNQLAEDRPFTWFKSNMIHTVPWPYPGFGRRVYPGFVQLYSFMSMNEDKHVDAHRDYFGHLVSGDGDGAQKHEAFYNEYLSVLDLTEEFYLQTIDIVFQQHLLARGLLDALTWQDALVCLAILLLVRPLAGMLAMAGSPHPPLERWLLAFLGIRGIGSMYYVAYGINHGNFGDSERLWAAVGFLILASIVIHGLSSDALLRHLARRRAQTQDPA